MSDEELGRKIREASQACNTPLVIDDLRGCCLVLTIRSEFAHEGDLVLENMRSEIREVLDNCNCQNVGILILNGLDALLVKGG